MEMKRRNVPTARSLFRNFKIRILHPPLYSLITLCLFKSQKFKKTPVFSIISHGPAQLIMGHGEELILNKGKHFRWLPHVWCYHVQPCFSCSEVWVHLWNDVNAISHSNNEDIRHFPSKIVASQQRQIIEK